MQEFCWLFLFVLFLVIEIISLGLTTIWFALGAIVAYVITLFTHSWLLEFIAFLLVSVLSFLYTRPIAIKYFNFKRTATNIETLVGQNALVLETIDSLHNTGKVEVHGQEWSAKSTNPSMILEKGKVVIIEGIEGVKLVVK